MSTLGAELSGHCGEIALVDLQVKYEQIC